MSKHLCINVSQYDSSRIALKIAISTQKAHKRRLILCVGRATFIALLYLRATPNSDISVDLNRPETT